MSANSAHLTTSQSQLYMAVHAAGYNASSFIHSTVDGPVQLRAIGSYREPAHLRASFEMKKVRLSSQLPWEGEAIRAGVHNHGMTNE